MLFANGSPISLEAMELNQLGKFLIFLLQCESGETISNSLNDIKVPKWWPFEIEYNDDFVEIMIKKGVKSINMMRQLIQRCYDYHNSTFLLELSRKLMIFSKDPNKIKVINNDNGTRSIINTYSNKCLVTFQSENQDYDKNL